MDKKEKKDTVKDEEIEVLEIWQPHVDEIKSAKDRHIKMSKQSVNKLVIILTVLAAFLIMWYSTFAQPLAFNVRQERIGNWEICFTDIYLDDTTGTAEEVHAPSNTCLNATFNVAFHTPGDSATYDVTITNSGDLDAELVSIVVNSNKEDQKFILYSVEGIDEGDVLKAGDSVHAKVSASYNKNVVGRPGDGTSFSIRFNYEEEKES